MFNKYEALKQRADLREKVNALDRKAKSENDRALTPDEKKEWTAAVEKIQDLTIALDRHEAGAHFGSAERDRGGLVNGAFPVAGPEGSAGYASGNGSADSRFKFAGLADYLRDPHSNGIRATLSEGGDLVHVLPGAEVMPFIRAYPSVDPLASAGASIENLPGGWVDGNVPIITSGTEPSSYAEGSGPTNDEPASVYVAQLKDPAKYAFLCKPTEEAMQDISGLASVLGQEGIRRVLNKVTKAATLALCSQLTSASATVLHSGDNYEDMLNMIAAIPTMFAGGSNVWMGSRRTKAYLRNTRAGADNLPVFNAEQTTLLGYSFIQNDYVPEGKLIFGDFGSGVFLRRSGIIFQILQEAYREAGKIGLRFYQRADWAFFAEAANASQSEQPLYLLTSDFGS